MALSLLVEQVDRHTRVACPRMALGRRSTAVLLIVSTAVVFLLSLQNAPPASAVRAPPSQQLAATSADHLSQNVSAKETQATVPTEACGDDPVIYPEWPAGFAPNVNAVFIVGALHQI